MDIIITMVHGTAMLASVTKMFHMCFIGLILLEVFGIWPLILRDTQILKAKYAGMQ